MSTPPSVEAVETGISRGHFRQCYDVPAPPWDPSKRCDLEYTVRCVCSNSTDAGSVCQTDITRSVKKVTVSFPPSALP